MASPCHFGCSAMQFWSCRSCPEPGKCSILCIRYIKVYSHYIWTTSYTIGFIKFDIQMRISFIVHPHCCEALEVHLKMYLSTFSYASLSGVGVGAALRATLHHLDGIPGFQGRKTLRNVTCSCKSSLEKSRSLGLYRYFLGGDVSLVFACLEVFCESLTLSPTESTRHSNQLYPIVHSQVPKASVVDEALVGTTRQLLMTGRAQQKTVAKNTNGMDSYDIWTFFQIVIYITYRYIFLYTLLSFSCFNRFSSTSSWCVAFKDLAFFSALATFGRVHWTLLTAMSKKAPKNTKNA